MKYTLILLLSLFSFSTFAGIDGRYSGENGYFNIPKDEQSTFGKGKWIVGERPCSDEKKRIRIHDVNATVKISKKQVSCLSYSTGSISTGSYVQCQVFSGGVVTNTISAPESSSLFKYIINYIKKLLK